DRINLAAHLGVDVDHLTERKHGRIDSREPSSGDTGRSCQAAIHVNVSVLSGHVADLRVETIGPQHLQFAILEKDRAGPPHEVDVTFDVAVSDKAALVARPRALQQEGVLEALQSYAVEHNSQGVTAKRFGL